MGKFILNDLLSEGTVYTLDGKNIFDNQYYSFIGMTDDSFYCSTNVPESSIAQFPRTDLFAVKPNGILAEDKPSNDKVVVDDKVGWISGFCGGGGCYIQDIFGNYITMCGKNYKHVAITKCKIINKNNNWRDTPSVSPPLK